MTTPKFKKGQILYGKSPYTEMEVFTYEVKEVMIDTKGCTNGYLNLMFVQYVYRLKAIRKGDDDVYLPESSLKTTKKEYLQSIIFDDESEAVSSDYVDLPF